MSDTAAATPGGTARLTAISRAGPARRARAWSYPADAGGRDLRIDFLRGLAILFVVVDHIDLRSAYHVISHERIGVVSGAELFVILAGVVLGMTQRRRAVADGWRAAANRAWARARLLYIVCIVVFFVSFGMSHLPRVDPDELTTWTDTSTGITYSMYGSTPSLTDYPVPAGAVLDLVFLGVGPFQFNVIGLYVVLLLATPFVIRLVMAGRWAAVLAASVGLYLLNEFAHLRLMPSQYEDQFPLLSWQLLFVVGLLAGAHWHEVVAWFSTPWGRATFLLCCVAAVGFLLFAWSNPARELDPWGLRWAGIPSETFGRVYEDFFRRDFLGVLRVINAFVFLIVSYAMLTRFWSPLNRLFGWLLIPLGGATLYVFILHLAFALLIASLPVFDQGSVLEYTIVHTAILLALWLMVRHSILFRWIPR